VSDNYAALGLSPAIAIVGEWGEYSNTTNFPVAGVNRLLFAPSGAFHSSQNAGQFSGGSAGAVLRGGGWYYPSYDGLFTASLGNAPSDTGNGGLLGFRCVFLP
jgi:hypothetical protein